MSNGRLPYMPVYVDEFDTSQTVKRLSYEGEGVFFALMRHQWRDGSLPPTEPEVRALLDMEPAEYPEMWALVEQKFPLKNGRRVNAKLAGLRRHALGKVRMARDLANMRWQKVRDAKADANADAKAHAIRGSKEGSKEGNKGKGNKYSPPFEQAWAAYPQRHGTNSKQAAYRQWCARLAEGVSPETLLSGTIRYAGECQDKIGTPFVKQAATFYGRDRHFEYDTPATNGHPARRAPQTYDYEPGVSGPEL